MVALVMGGMGRGKGGLGSWGVAVANDRLNLGADPVLLIQYETWLADSWEDAVLQYFQALRQYYVSTTFCQSVA